jgi:hypothetical protein
LPNVEFYANVKFTQMGVIAMELCNAVDGGDMGWMVTTSLGSNGKLETVVEFGPLDGGVWEWENENEAELGHGRILRALILLAQPCHDSEVPIA